jgi:hypothetical protein
VTWTCGEIRTLVNLYPHCGLKRVLKALPEKDARGIEAMVRKIGLRRIFVPPRIPIRTAHLHYYLIAQSYFIRRNLAATE